MCSVLQLELQKRIDQEGVRNHVDLRHRLDAQGQRYGKVIAYKYVERALASRAHLLLLMPAVMLQAKRAASCGAAR